MPSSECCHCWGHSNGGSQPGRRGQDKVKYCNVDRILNCLWPFRYMNAVNGVYKGALDCAKQTVVRYVSSKIFLSDIQFNPGRGCQPCTEASLPAAVVWSAGTLSSGSPMNRSSWQHAQSATKIQ